MNAPALLLAEASIGPYLLWIGALIAAIVVATSIILFMRKKLFDPHSGADANRGVFEELRILRDTGKISQDEFDAAKRKIVQRIAQDSLKNSAERPPAPPSIPSAMRPPAP